MTPGRVLAELEALAARLGVAVRAEPFGKGVLEGRGGLCWVDGRPLVVMDAKLAVPERIAVLAGALGKFDLEVLTIAPQIRERIEDARRARKKRAPRKKRPGLARARPRGRRPTT
ncbi:MAG TPA: hypothetical protein VIJ22_15985 [Polyangiaceae bacterium]